MSKMLADARAKLEEGDRAAALNALLEAWREQPTNELADVIDELSDAITASLPPITAVGKLSARKAWEELAAKQDPCDLGRLLAVLPDDQQRAMRLRALREWPRDPRIATAARGWFTKPPLAGARRNSLFLPLIEILAHHVDPRMIPHLREATTKEARSATIRRLGLRSWKPLVALAAKVGHVKPATLGDDDRDTLAAIRALLGPKPQPKNVDPTELFTRVYENPDDDEARSVLSDLLQQLGDPRGEFIALQLARAASGAKRSSRERELEETWGRKWLGALDPVLLADGLVFERGFVARCRYSGGTTYGAVEWSTVTHVDCTTASGFITYSHRMLLHPVMRALRHAVGLAREDLVEIVRGRSLPWRTIGARMWRWDDVVPLANGPQGVLEEVDTIVLSPASGPFVELATPMIERLLASWPKLAHVEIALAPEHVSAMARIAKVQALTVHTQRDARVHLEARTLRISTSGIRYLDFLASVVGELDRHDLFDRIELRPGAAKRVGDELVRASDRWSIAPLLQIAARRGVSLTVA